MLRSIPHLVGKINPLYRYTPLPLNLKLVTYQDFTSTKHMDVSENNGTPKSSILMRCFIINHPFWGTFIFGNTYTCFLYQATEGIGKHSFPSFICWTYRGQTKTGWSLFGEDSQFDEHIFQRGWFNHQREKHGHKQLTTNSPSRETTFHEVDLFDSPFEGNFSDLQALRMAILGTWSLGTSLQEGCGKDLLAGRCASV